MRWLRLMTPAAFPSQDSVPEPSRSHKRPAGLSCCIRGLGLSRTCIRARFADTFPFMGQDAQIQIASPAGWHRGQVSPWYHRLVRMAGIVPALAWAAWSRARGHDEQGGPYVGVCMFSSARA